MVRNRLTLQNHLLLFRDLASLTPGEYVTEELKDGRTISLIVPGARERKLSYHTKRWDILLCLDGPKGREDIITYREILQFIDDVDRIVDREKAQKLLFQAIEVIAGAEPTEFQDIAIEYRGYFGHKTINRSDEYILKTIKWLAAIEDRYYFSEMPQDEMYHDGRFRFLSCLVEYAQGISYDEACAFLEGEKGRLKRPKVNYEMVDGLRDLLRLCDQLYPYRGRLNLCFNPDFHSDCRAAINEGLDHGERKLCSERVSEKEAKILREIFWESIKEYLIKYGLI